MCAKALKAESSELEQVMKELREAITQHMEFTRAMAYRVFENLGTERTQEDKRGDSKKKTA